MQQLSVLAPIKSCRIIDIAVNCVAICINKHEHKIGITHAPFNFEGCDPSMNQFRYMLVHEHIFCSERIFCRVNLAVLFHTVIPAARLEALSSVGAHTEHH
ncbi:hypothetical protein D3C73_1107550 [compost metagenome]